MLSNSSDFNNSENWWFPKPWIDNISDSSYLKISAFLHFEISGCTTFWMSRVRKAFAIPRSWVLRLSQISISPKCRCRGHWLVRQMWNLVFRHCSSSGFMEFASAGSHKIIIAWVLNCCGCVDYLIYLSIMEYRRLRNFSFKKLQGSDVVDCKDLWASCET